MNNYTKDPLDASWTDTPEQKVGSDIYLHTRILDCHSSIRWTNTVALGYNPASLNVVLLGRDEICCLGKCVTTS